MVSVPLERLGSRAIAMQFRTKARSAWPHNPRKPNHAFESFFYPLFPQSRCSAYRTAIRKQLASVVLIRRRL